MTSSNTDPSVVDDDVTSNGSKPLLSFPDFLSWTSSGIQSLLDSTTASDTTCSSATEKDRTPLLYSVVMGNEAGDADSIVSALALSYIRYARQQQDALSAHKKTTTTVVPVPLVSISRRDVTLRNDVTLLFRMSGIDLESLLYLDDDGSIFSLLYDDSKQRNIAITLTDHNNLPSSLCHHHHHIHEDVVEIIDHHRDEGFHSQVTATKRNIAFENNNALVGSTCTLLVEEIVMHDRKRGEKNNKMDPSLAISLLGVILLDTMNMNEETGKGTERDDAAIRAILDSDTAWDALSSHKDSGVDDNKHASLVKGGVPDREALYQCLIDAKFDTSFWERLSPRDVLRMDYKRFEIDDDEGCSEKHAFGLSSVLLSVPSLLDKHDFCTDVANYMKEMNISLLGILSTVRVHHPQEQHHSNTVRREIVLFGSRTIVTDMTDYLITNDDEDNDLGMELPTNSKDEEEKDLKCHGSDRNEEKDEEDPICCQRLTQRNWKASRKQIAPIMTKFFSSSSSPM